MNVKNKISFTCDNLMVDRIINRQKAKGYIPEDYRTVMILNCENELINYKDYHEALSKDGIFIVLAYLIFPTFETAKEIKFEPNFEDDFYHNFLITTRKTRYIYLVPESRCPYHYVSPDFFGIKVQIIDDLAAYFMMNIQPNSMALSILKQLLKITRMKFKNQ